MGLSPAPHSDHRQVNCVVRTMRPPHSTNKWRRNSSASGSLNKLAAINRFHLGSLPFAKKPAAPQAHRSCNRTAKSLTLSGTIIQFETKLGRSKGFRFDHKSHREWTWADEKREGSEPRLNPEFPIQKHWY